MPDPRAPHIGIVAGEASGDLIGAAIIRALRERIPNLRCSGVGGTHMHKAGIHSLGTSSKLAVLGFWQPLFRLAGLLRFRRFLRDYYLDAKPDLFLGIDAPDFNLALERSLRRRGIYTAHCVSPSVWAWRSWRIARIRESVNMMFSIFPFEAAFYRKHKVPVRYIGHPLADALDQVADRDALRTSLGLDASAPVLAILPGSRYSEIKKLADLFARTASACLRSEPGLQLVVSIADPGFLPHVQRCFERAIGKQVLSSCKLLYSTQPSAQLMAAADVVLIASGTASLEALLLDRPMVIAYRIDFLSYWLFKMLSTIKYYSLPNLLVDERLVPEFYQYDATVANLAQSLLKQLRAPASERKRLSERYAVVREGLKKDAARTVADSLAKILSGAGR